MSSIENIFSQQASNDSFPDSNSRLNSRQLVQFYSPIQRIFKQQADASYQGNGGTLTWNIDHYELGEANGSRIVFLPNDCLNYVEYSKGYPFNAEYNTTSSRRVTNRVLLKTMTWFNTFTVLPRKMVVIIILCALVMVLLAVTCVGVLKARI